MKHPRKNAVGSFGIVSELSKSLGTGNGFYHRSSAAEVAAGLLCEDEVANSCWRAIEFNVEVPR